MSRSPAMSGKAITTKSLKEKWSSKVQSARENGENGIGGSSTVTLASFENTRVTCSGMVMVASDNRTAEVGIGRNIDMAMVRQNASIVVPVRESGAESCQDFTWESMEGIQDQWVRGRGRAEFIGE